MDVNGGRVRDYFHPYWQWHELISYLANMKVITSIYLNCRPDLRDEWLTGTEVEDVTDALVRREDVLALM